MLIHPTVDRLRALGLAAMADTLTELQNNPEAAEMPHAENRGVKIMKRRGIVDDLDIFTLEEIQKHPYYQEFLAPHGLRWFGGVHISCGDETWCLSIQRTIAQGPFTAEEKRHLGNLANRLSGAAAIASTIGDAIHYLS